MEPATAAAATAAAAADSVRYDRQLRLWGAGTQQRLQNSRLLCIGVNGLIFEVLKNAVLAGIGAVAISSALRRCSDEDHRTIHAVHRGDVEQQRSLGSVIHERLTRMNPLVSTNDVSSFDDHKKAEWALDAAGGYSMVVIAGESVSQVRGHLAVLDDVCRQRKPQNVVVLVTSYCAHATCGVFLTAESSACGVVAQPLSVQWDQWVAQPDSEVATRPVPVQLCLLQLDLQEALVQEARRRELNSDIRALPFRTVVALALRCAETRLGRDAAASGFQGLLQILLDSWSASSSRDDCAPHVTSGQSGAVEFSVGGGFLSQQLIARLSRASEATAAAAGKTTPTSNDESRAGEKRGNSDSDVANAPPKSYSWIATWTPSVGDQECVVG